MKWAYKPHGRPGSPREPKANFPEVQEALAKSCQVPVTCPAYATFISLFFGHKLARSGSQLLC
jgi:hypothetical protein